MVFRICTFTLLLTLSLYAQKLKVPENIELKNKDDYKRTEEFLLDCIDLVESTPINEKNDELKLAMAFELKWITGCPYIIINVTALMNKFGNINSIFSIIYLGGWTKSAIMNSYKISNIDGNYAGVQSVLEYYKNNEEIDRNDFLDELLKYDEKKMKDWIKEELKKK